MTEHDKIIRTIGELQLTDDKIVSKIGKVGAIGNYNLVIIRTAIFSLTWALKGNGNFLSELFPNGIKELK